MNEPMTDLNEMATEILRHQYLMDHKVEDREKMSEVLDGQMDNQIIETMPILQLLDQAGMGEIHQEKMQAINEMALMGNHDQILRLLETMEDYSPAGMAENIGMGIWSRKKEEAQMEEIHASLREMVRGLDLGVIQDQMDLNAEREKRERIAREKAGSESTPESTPDDSSAQPADPTGTPAPKQIPDHKLSKVNRRSSKLEERRERRRQNMQEKGLATVSMTDEQQEIIDELIEIEAEDQIEALEALDELDDFEAEVLAAFKAHLDPNTEITTDQAIIIEDYVDIAIEEEIEILENKENLSDEDKEFLEAYRAYQAETSQPF